MISARHPLNESQEPLYGKQKKYHDRRRIGGCGHNCFFLFFQTDEAKIKKKFHKLSGIMEKTGDEHDLIAAKKAHAFEQMFFGSVRIQIPSYEVDKTFPKNEISPHVLYARSLYQNISLTFHDFQFEFPTKKSAIVDVTGVLEATTNNGQPVNEIHEAECTLEKIDGEWMLTGIKGVDVLER